MKLSSFQNLSLDNYGRRDYSHSGRKGHGEKALKIIEKINTGLTDAEISPEFGITVQYVNYLRNKKV